MQANRYLILTERTLGSQDRTPLPHQLALQNPKEKRNKNVPQTYQLCESKRINRKQKTSMQNQGIRFSAPNLITQIFVNQSEKAKFFKFHAIEKINLCKENEAKIEGSSQKKVLLKKQSATKCFYQKIHTQIVKKNQNNEEILPNEEMQRKANRQKMYKIRSKEDYEADCKKNKAKQQEQEVNDLFLHVNRQMKLSLKRKEGNNFYQKIRKNAIKKINYMSHNQKYYDKSEVKHLNSVVENCNILIHKRDCKISAKKLYQTYKHRQLTEYKEIKDKNQSTTAYSNKQLSNKKHQKSKVSISKTVLQELQKKSLGAESQSTSYFKQKASQPTQRLKTQRLIQQTQFLSSRMNKIVNSCSQQQLNMQQVKKGMKIFQFYCNKLDQGFNSREIKLNNFLKWEEIDQ